MPVTLEDVAYRALPRVAPGRALALSEWRTLVRVAEVLVADGPHGVTPENVADNVEAFLVAGRSRRAWRVRVLLTFIQIAPIATHRRTFEALSFDERRAFICERWTPERRLGRLCSKVKNLVVLGAYGDPRAAARIGYVPVLRRSRFAEHAARLRETGSGI
jgi:hypothetical protein